MKNNENETLILGRQYKSLKELEDLFRDEGQVSLNDLYSTPDLPTVLSETDALGWNSDLVTLDFVSLITDGSVLLK